MNQEKECEICGMKDEVLLVDAIFNGKPAIICRDCTLIHDVVILQKPTEEQLSSINTYKSVRQRLAKSAGVNLPEEQQKPVLTFKPEDIRPRVWKLQEEKFPVKKLGEKAEEEAKAGRKFGKDFVLDLNIESEQEAEKKRVEWAEIKEKRGKAEEKIKVIKDFSDRVIKTRKKRNLTQKQLADALVLSEYDIIQAEKGVLPNEIKEKRKILKRLEQFLHLNLIEEDVEIEPETTQEIEPSKIDFHSKILTLADLKKLKEKKKFEEENKNANENLEE